MPPEGAHQLASAPHCRHQAYVLRDMHLLVQSHLEMTPDRVALVLQKNGAQLLEQYEAGNPAASPPEDVRSALLERTAAMRAVLGHLYR